MFTDNNTDPLAMLVASHRQTRLYLGVLSRLAPDMTATENHALLSQAITWFDKVAPTQQQIIEHTLFPALLESMAGSDAVCIQGMERRFARDSTALAQGWHTRLRPALDIDTTPPDGQRYPLGAQPVQGFLEQWLHHYARLLDFADQELLPMANRLLDAHAMHELATACADLPPQAAPDQGVR